MKRFVVWTLAWGWLGLSAERAPACWKGIEPRAFASRCPIIVTGTITKIEPAGTSNSPAHDTAVITIAAVHKNALKDLPLRTGDTLTDERQLYFPPDDDQESRSRLTAPLANDN